MVGAPHIPAARAAAGGATAPHLRPPDLLELTYLALALGVGLAAWLALLLAQLRLFPGAAAVAGVVALGFLLGLACAARIAGRATRLPERRTLAGSTAVLVAASYLLLGRPHEYVFGGLDPGVYVNTAAHLARTGSLLWYDRDVAALSDLARQALFREPGDGWTQGSRLVGFYLTDGAPQRVVPHGMHLFPAALAVGFALGGLPGALAVPPLLATLAVGGGALLARRLAGGPAGLLAAALLLLNPAEAWYGRYPAAELAVQAFLFAGLLALAYASGERQHTPAPRAPAPVGASRDPALLAIPAVPLPAATHVAAAAAGFLVGLPHLAKIDTFVVPVAIAMLVGWLGVTGRLRRHHLTFLLAYAATLVHAILHVVTVAGAYTYSVYARSLPSAGTLVIAAPLIFLALIGAWRLVRARRRAQDGARWECRGRLILVGLAVALASYAWLLRPLDLWGEVAAAPDALRATIENRLGALPRLGWYLPDPLLALALVGLVFARRRVIGVAGALMIAIALLEALIVLADPRITPEYPWAARRWVGILIPGAVVLAAAAVGWLAGPAGRQPAGVGGVAVPPAECPLPTPARRAAALLIATLALATSAFAARPLLSHQEYAGAAALVHRLAAATPVDAVILFDDDLVGWRLSTPIAHLAGRTAFVLFGAAADDDRLAVVLTEWERSGRPVYWLRHREDPAYYGWGRYWRPERSWKTELHEVRSTVDRPPFDRRAFDVPVTLYLALTSDT